MGGHRASYKKTLVVAAAGVAACLLMGLFILCATALDLPGTQVVLEIPLIVRWLLGLLLLGLALFGCAVTVGGLMALHYDAKGRAVY